MIVYIDNDFKCHVLEADGFRAIETDIFDGKCPEYIEGYRFIPAGETWVRKDGVVFNGEMVAPWKPYDELAALQTAYERERLAAALALLEKNNLLEELN